MNLAKLMIENSFLIDKQARYHDARYVIVSHKEKSKTITNDSGADQSENAEGNSAGSNQMPGSGEGGQVAIPGKDLNQAVSIQQLKDLLAAERARTENNFHEIKNLF
jgi:hypothetical protein